MFTMFRKLDTRTEGRLLAIKIRSRGLARHGVRPTVRIPVVSMADLVARREAA